MTGATPAALLFGCAHGKVRAMIPRHVPLVETTRGGATECVHYGSVAVVDAHGELLRRPAIPIRLTSRAVR